MHDDRGGLPRLLPFLGLLVFLIPPGVARAVEPAAPFEGERPTAEAYSDRGQSVAMVRARLALEGGNAAEGLTLLHAILEEPADAFVPGLAVGGAKQAAQELLTAQPLQIQELDQALREGAARQALAAAVAQGNLDGLRAVAIRFPGTASGYEAANRLAGALFDQADFHAAAAVWLRLVDEPRHAGRVTPAVLLKVAMALQRSRRPAEAVRLLARLDLGALQVAGGRMPAAALFPAELGPPPVMPATGAAATAAERMTGPAFPPVWEGATIPKAGLTVCRSWAQTRQAEARPVAVAGGAAVSAGCLVVRGWDGLTAFQPHSGKVSWKAEGMSAMLPPAGATSLPGGDIDSLAEQFDAAVAGVGVYGRISSDGDRVYVVDRGVPGGSYRVASGEPTTATERAVVGEATNRLLAYALVPEAAGVSTASGDAVPRQRPVWVVGDGGPGLREVYFLGPPVPTPIGLLILGEYRQSLVLIALDAVSGQPLWQQPLCFVPRPVSSDAQRAAAECRPTVVDGIAVCPTNAGFVIGVDVLQGRLLWAYDYRADEIEASARRERGAESPTYSGEPSLPAPVVVCGDDVVCLPHDSGRLHCLDLRSGLVRWAVPRDDGLYVGCVGRDSALLVGRAGCRSLALRDGATLWTTHSGMPSGTGIVTASAYLLPLESGRILSLALATGQPVGFDDPRAETSFVPLPTATALPTAGSVAGSNAERNHWRPGNLFTDGTNLVSVGATGVTLLRTADAQLADATATLTALETARLQLAAARLSDAERTLKTAQADATQLPAEEAVRLLRELYFLRLSGEAGVAAQTTLAALEPLCARSADRARFLMYAAMCDAARNDRRAILRRAHEFAALELAGPIPSATDPTHLVTHASWLPALLRSLTGSAGETEEVSAGLSWSRELALLAKQSDAALSERLLCGIEGRLAAAVRLELGRRAVAEGESSRAELLLVDAAAAGDSAAVAELNVLWRRAGLLPPELVSLRQPQAGAGQTSGGSTQPMSQSQVPVAGVTPIRSQRERVGQVAIHGELWKPAAEPVCKAFNRSRRTFLTRGDHPFRIVDRGDSREARLAFINLNEGISRGEVALPAALRFPALARQPAAGHFYPIATTGRVYGLSLLEADRGEPLWNVEVPGGDTGLLPQFGPYGTSFCMVQTRRELLVLDPATGRTLWQRNGLPPDAGLHGDHYTGAFGDEHVLVLMDADGAACTVYDTRTGDELRRCRLPIDHRRQRRTFGRKLFFVTGEAERSVARLWDPATDRDELTLPFDGRILTACGRGDELALLFADGRFLLYDAVAGRMLFELNLSEEETAGVHKIEVFSDAERFYVSLNRAEPDRFERPQTATYLYDTPLAVAHVQGRLLAVERMSGQVLWSRDSDQRSLLCLPEERLPFLISLARMTNREQGSRKSLLVEAIDVKTGVTLGLNDALLSDQLLQVRREADRVILAGMNSSVVLTMQPEAEAISNWSGH